jgi:peptidoglycan/xylan/chitin deacetylase (PgdA/CDA1 family)
MVGGGQCRMSSEAPPGRRQFLALLGGAAASLVAACRGDVLPGAHEAGATPATTTTARPSEPTTTTPSTTNSTSTATATPTAAVQHLIPPAVPGRPTIVAEGPRHTNAIALTIDDGTSPECIDRYVAFAQRTGIALTFSPNGINPGWDTVAPRLRPLVEAGQVQIANHTWSHPSLVKVGDGRIRAEIERNEEWIQRTFGTTARPWFRPPYGAHSARTDGIAASLGYTRIVLWNGSFGDSELLRPDEVLALAERYMQAGTIMLGHANYLTITDMFDRVQLVMAQRGLRPVTLDEMFRAL